MRRCPSETAALNKRQRPRRAEKSGGGALCAKAALGGGRPEKVPRPNRCLRFGATCRIIGKTVPRKGEGGGPPGGGAALQGGDEHAASHIGGGRRGGRGGTGYPVPPPEGDPGAGGHSLHRGQRGERLRGGHNPPAGPGHPGGRGGRDHPGQPHLEPPSDRGLPGRATVISSGRPTTPAGCRAGASVYSGDRRGCASAC